MGWGRGWDRGRRWGMGWDRWGLGGVGGVAIASHSLEEYAKHKTC